MSLSLARGPVRLSRRPQAAAGEACPAPGDGGGPWHPHEECPARAFRIAYGELHRAAHGGNAAGCPRNPCESLAAALAPGGDQDRSWHREHECPLTGLVRGYAELHYQAHGRTVAECGEYPCTMLADAVVPCGDGAAARRENRGPGDGRDRA